MSCCLESKVAIGSGPTVAPKKQTLNTKADTETGEDLVK